MMTVISSEDLGEILSHALEEAAFVFVEQAEALPEEAGEVCQAQIAVSGSTRYQLVLCVSVEFSDVLAANLLGVEPGEEEAEGKGIDAIGVILNIVAGIVLDRANGGGLGLKIGTPDVRVTNMAEHLRLVDSPLARSLLVSEDGHWIDIAAVSSSSAGC